ncbi:hypothetical protein K438DRAFT_1962627 [Mycena galopus ATCC 62051]|nr:hypothetical protein K438DRAFT_1962627 [Mycena galopus ATCC 62051]
MANTEKPDPSPLLLLPLVCFVKFFPSRRPLPQRECGYWATTASDAFSPSVLTRAEPSLPTFTPLTLCHVCNHARLTLRKINTYGLWFEWTGANAALKPVLFMAHQGLSVVRRLDYLNSPAPAIKHNADVVPVDPSTVGDWTHPPYFDGQRIWGRGSADDKNGLVGILTAIETLLSHGFTPARTVVAAFGFDEEASGLEGAGTLARALLTAYGEDAFAFILDEGDGIVKTFGTPVAYPCVAEKGYLDVVVEVTSPGGHSSVPPEHTTIGILAALIVEYEANLYPVHLVLPHLHPLSDPPMPRAAHTQHPANNTRINPPALRTLILASAHSDTALRTLEAVLAQDKLYRSQIGTTQAVDIVSGGVKANALPEQARAVVNHRILAESSVAAVRAHNVATLRALAERKFNLSFTAFGVEVSDRGRRRAGRYAEGYTPPVSAAAGSIKAAYETRARRGVPTSRTRTVTRHKDNDTVVVAPAIMSGNTVLLEPLPPHIPLRARQCGRGAGPEDGDVLNGIHTVDECACVLALPPSREWRYRRDDFVEIIRFYITLILNADESVVL